MRTEVKRGDKLDKKKVFVELDRVRDSVIPSLGYSLKVIFHCLLDLTFFGSETLSIL